MKRLKIYLFVLLGLGAVSCSEDSDLGEIEPLKPEYTLPQGKSPADGRIVQMYEDFGTYILYDYTFLDFHYEIHPETRYTPADPAFAGDMLDLLEDVWFGFYPKEFNRTFMPYKIFLTDTLEYRGMLPIASGSHCIAVSGCNKNIASVNKLTLKKKIQQSLWSEWKHHPKMTIPEDFFEISTYKMASYNPNSPDYTRRRGFIRSSDGREWSTTPMNSQLMIDPQKDFDSFIAAMVSRTSKEWENDLKWPLIKQKYDFLQNYYLEHFNIDLVAVGNKTY